MKDSDIVFLKPPISRLYEAGFRPLMLSAYCNPRRRLPEATNRRTIGSRHHRHYDVHRIGLG